MGSCFLLGHPIICGNFIMFDFCKGLTERRHSLFYGFRQFHQSVTALTAFDNMYESKEQSLFNCMQIFSSNANVLRDILVISGFGPRFG